MFKIASGFLAVVATVAVVGAAAFANFSADVTVNGLGLESGTPGLQVFDPTPGTYGPSVTLTPPTTKVGPGQEVTQTFTIKNSSDYGSSNMSLHAQIVPGASGDWEALKSYVLVKFSNGSDTSAEHTLNEWFENGYDMGINVATGVNKDVTATLRLAAGAPQSAAGKTISTNWKITGTEVTPAE